MGLGGRAHVVAVLSLLAAALTAAGAALAGPSADAAAPRPPRAPAAAAAAPAAAPARPACSRPAPTTTTGYQAMFDAKNDGTWAGGDQAASVPLGDGRVLWMFGDTVRGSRLPDGSRGADSAFVHNSLLVQDGGCLTAVPAATEAVPGLPDGDWYWPQDAVRVGQRLVVFCARVHRTGTGPHSFTTVGVDAAVFAVRGGTLVLERMAPTPSSHAPEPGDQYGKALVQQGGWLYVYGSRGSAGSFGRAVTVARVRPAALLTPSAWRYWTGTGWARRPASAHPVVPAGRTGWSTAFSVFRAGGRLHGLSKEEDAFGRSVVAASATAPTGPFSRTVVLDAPSSRDGVLLYNALAHPELRLASGMLLVTVCRNSGDLKRVWADTDLYKPQFSQVPRP